MVVYRKIYRRLYDACGGTVEYVSSTNYDFTPGIEIREDAGTPPILQVIRTVLAMNVKRKNWL